MVAFRSRSSALSPLVRFGGATSVGSKAVDGIDAMLSKGVLERARRDCVGIFVALLFFLSLLTSSRIIFISSFMRCALS